MDRFLREAKEKIPSVDFILQEALKRLKFKKELAKKKFGKILVSVDDEATKIFKEYERKALLELAKLWLKEQKEEVRKRFEKIISKKGWDDFIK